MTGPGTATREAPRPFVCVLDDLHRDPEVAREARAGWFTHAGHRLWLGRTPDWLGGGLAHDEEWRIEWVKGYEGLDLADEFCRTGNPDSLAAWEDLVLSFCEQVPVGHDTSDVSARRIQNWLYAWQRFAEGAAWQGLRPGLAALLERRLAEDGDHLRQHLTPARNHRTLELYALLVLALARGEEHEAREALAALAENAAADVLPDGVHCEASSDYHMIVLRSFVGAVANARGADLPVPAPLEGRTRAMCDVALHLQRPDGSTPALSDGDPGDYRPLLRRAAALLDRPDLLWAASGGREGTPPAERSVDFPDGGYHVQRSGWGEHAPYRQERWAVLDCGPLGVGGHGHYDQLSVELAGAGHRFVVDPGRYTYAEDGTGWRAWFKGTGAHNTVTVDGLDQAPYRRGKPKGPTPTATLLWRATSPGLDVMCAEARSPRYDAVHRRTVAFVDDALWVVHDRLTADEPHGYTASWHLDVGAEGRTGLATYEAGTVVTAPAGTLVVPAGFGEVSLLPGWVSPSYGLKLPAPVVRVTPAGRAADADLLTVLVPGGPAPTVSAHAVADGLLVLLGRAGGPGLRLRLTPTSAAVDRGGEPRS